ncbi:MAG: oxygen-independent coproporphyrinogen III oxidase-like protein [Betaproteobacteria bacterium]|nr:oxygen-independent coproporphyrinogen III oxidase-like protein [Betaproteobacteria bacterium]
MGNEINARVIWPRPSPITRHPSPRFRAPPPLALYVHIPWCVRKCPYCDFNSHEARGGVPEQEYIAALVADLESALPQVWGRRVYSVFFGGGTPSLFSARGIEAILSAVRARLPLASDAEITLEANPGTFEAEKFKAFRAAGVNRLSIGIQSFNPAHLEALGRIHDEREARRAIESARDNFENFNLDLMYGLPRQTVEDARADIEAALEYAPPHISAYHLTIEPNTYFHRFPPKLPDDDATAAMQTAIEELLAARGYHHYEVSAFAQQRDSVSGSDEGRVSPLTAVCRHNLNYWTFGDYLGIGAGAHSKLSFRDRIVRQARYRQPKQYMEAASEAKAVQTEKEAGSHEIGFEFMMNALRLVDGFESELFEERTGLPLTVVLKELDEAERRGFITRDHRRIVPTLQGRRFLNDLLQILLPESATA